MEQDLQDAERLLTDVRRWSRRTLNPQPDWIGQHATGTDGRRIVCCVCGELQADEVDWDPTPDGRQIPYCRLFAFRVPTDAELADLDCPSWCSREVAHHTEFDGRLCTDAHFTDGAVGLQRIDGDEGPGAVEVYVRDFDVSFTPQEARALAAALLAAAEQAEK